MGDIGAEAVDEDSEKGVHPHCNGKSSEAIKNTGVAAPHCAGRVRKRLKVQGLNDLKAIEEFAQAASPRFIRDANAASRRG
jgi:hypothetical protein